MAFLSMPNNYLPLIGFVVTELMSSFVVTELTVEHGLY